MRRYRLEIRGRDFVIDVDDLAANRFAVTVGGESYEVELAGDEDVSETTITPAFAPAHAAGTAHSAPAAAGAAPVARKASARSAAVVTPRKPAAGGGGGTLAAPMPGVVIEVAVKAGDTVVRGQQVVTLEAMKMQNSIKSPRAGRIADVCVTAGQAVGHGDALIRFEEG